MFTVNGSSRVKLMAIFITVLICSTFAFQSYLQAVPENKDHQKLGGMDLIAGGDGYAIGGDVQLYRSAPNVWSLGAGDDLIGIDELHSSSLYVGGNQYYPEQIVSFTIWKDGSNYYSRNEHTGAVASGTAAHTIINNAINTLTSGRTWNEVVALKGNITITSTILLPSYTTLVIYGQINVGADVVGIKVGSDTPDVLADYPTIHGGVIKGIASNTHEGILTYSRHGIYEDLEIQKMGVGIVIGESMLSCYENKLINLEVHNCTYEGVTIQSGDNMLNNVVSFWNDIGLKTPAYGGALATNVHLWENRVGLYNTGSVNDLYVNFQAEKNTDRNVLIDAVDGWVGNIRFSNPYIWGASTISVSILGSASYTVNYVTIDGGKVSDKLYVGANATNVKVSDCDLTGTDVSGVTYLDHNLGYVTENSGTATVLAGTWSITINHGLSYTPSLKDIRITPANDNASRLNYFVQSWSISSTQFTIGIADSAPTGNAVFSWCIAKTP